MTGICQMSYTWYIPVIWNTLSYDRYIPLAGIFQVYTVCRNMSGIYQVYTMIINFLRIPDDRLGHFKFAPSISYIDIKGVQVRYQKVSSFDIEGHQPSISNVNKRVTDIEVTVSWLRYRTNTLRYRTSMLISYTNWISESKVTLTRSISKVMSYISGSISDTI